MRCRLELVLFASLALLSLPACGATPGASPASSRTDVPETRRDDDVGDDFNGTWIPDPYRWLEDQDGSATATWVGRQNAATEAFLARLPGRERLRRRLTEIWNYEKHGAPGKAGDSWFYSYNDGLKDQSIVYRSKTPQGKGEVFLDPNSLSKDGTVALGGLSFSEDGQLLAYSFSRSGSDWREWKVIDLSTGAHLGDHLRWTKFTTATWLPDGSGFLYSRYPEPEEGKEFEAANKVPTYLLHKLGTEQKDDEVVYVDPAHPERRAGATLSDDQKFFVFTISSGTDARNRISVLDVGDLGKPPEPVFAELTASYRFLGNDGRVCYFLTDDGAARRRIVGVDVDDPKKEWRVPVAETTDTLESAKIVGERFVLTYLRDAHHVVKTCKLDGSDTKTVALPGIGSVSGFTGRRKDAATYFRFQSFTRPPSVYGLTLATGAVTLLHQPKIAFDPDAFVTKQVGFQSKDGTRIPMFLVHKRGLALDRNNPTYLYAYGGFNISLKPNFRPDRIAWLEAGGIYAQPSLRGGGEYGRDWHEAGMLTKKQNVFDDFAAAAEYLTRNHYTRREKLAIGGGSNGGLLVGATVTQHPEMFGAAVPEVGVLDMLRYHKFTIGHAWIPEYGSSDDPKMFATLRAYSPLHNIQPGTHYPATLVMTGDHDDRVLPAHSYKFAATLQRAQGGAWPILIRIDGKAGHGAGKPTSKRIAAAADRWAFLLRALCVE